MRIARQLPPGAQLFSVEVSPANAQVAEAVIRHAGLQAKATLLVGDVAQGIEVRSATTGRAALRCAVLGPGLQAVPRSGWMVAGWQALAGAVASVQHTATVRLTQSQPHRPEQPSGIPPPMHVHPHSPPVLRHPSCRQSVRHVDNACACLSRADGWLCYAVLALSCCAAPVPLPQSLRGRGVDHVDLCFIDHHKALYVQDFKLMRDQVRAMCCAAQCLEWNVLRCGVCQGSVTRT